jgi:hypothetical protein
MEFAACRQCNGGTSAADLVTSFFCRLSWTGEQPILDEALARRGKLRQIAPGVLEELLRPEKEQEVWLRKSGLLQPYIKINVDGPLTKEYLTVFTAKFGMALYREHVGAALPLTGGVHAQWFLNAGLATETAEKILAKMPMFGTVEQGKFRVPEQFSYRFNCDRKTIVAALASFHSNFHTFVIATSQPSYYKLPWEHPYSDFVLPGQLIERMPKSSALSRE